VIDPLDHIRYLAEKIGPRPSTGEGESQAAAYVAENLEKFGYTVKEEPFRSPNSFSQVYIPIYVLALMGFVAFVLGSLAFAVLLSGVAFVCFVGENTTALKLVSAVIPKGRSSNIVGRLAPRELPRRRLVLVAHLDSTRSGLMWHPRLVSSFRLTFLLLAICLALLPLLVVAEVLTGLRVFLPLSLPVALCIAYALFLLVHRELFFKHVDGANDNASGVGVMLTLAEVMSLDAPAETEVLIVATGCEEAGLVGMQSFLRRHKDELARSWIINIDNVGAGDVKYTTREGMLLPHRTGRELVETAVKVSSLAGINAAGAPFRVMSNDTEPALLRGLEAITVIALRDGVPVNWHWTTDTFENIDADTVDSAYRFVEQVVRRLIA
jgi:acetylornithine deacetylase/succinyl-diaminopimelate desuccinylase-like protein